MAKAIHPHLLSNADFGQGVSPFSEPLIWGRGSHLFQ